MLPSSIAASERSVLGRFALYAPRHAGAMTIWRAFLHDPWSPDSDLLVAAPRAGNEAIFRLLVAEAGPRIVVEREPLLAVRPAQRGVTLAELLDAPGDSCRARPPLELLALVARALDRPGLRVQRVTSPHQIVVTWDGDVLVDGLDPIARARPWADDDGLRADVEACLLAAVARGRTDFDGARALVDEVAAGKRTGGVIERAIIGRYSAALGKGHELDDVVDMASARAVVATLARELFPERVARDRLLLEELATLPPDVLERWPHQPPTPTPAPRAPLLSTADTALMLREATAESALVATETAAFVDDTRRALMLPPRPPRPRTESLLERLGRFFGDAWARLRHRVAAARVPRQLPTSARPAPLPRRRRRRRTIRAPDVNLRPR